MKNLKNEGGLSDDESRKREEAFDIRFKLSTEFCDPEDVEFFIDFMKQVVISISVEKSEVFKNRSQIRFINIVIVISNIFYKLSAEENGI